MSAALRPFAIDLGLASALGSGKEATLAALSSGELPPLSEERIRGVAFRIARAPQSLRDMGDRDEDSRSRVNALLLDVAEQLRPSVAAAVERYGAHRIAVLLGSTDNGSEASLEAVSSHLASGSFPKGYSLYRQSPELAPRFLAAALGLKGPAMAVSTACASSATAIARARELITAGVCDAALAGGADIVSDSVALGFEALEAVSSERCLPFSRNRRGITLGEGAAVFLLCRDELELPGLRESFGRPPRLLGSGEASDAHHLTAPDPEGGGAQAAMEAALRDAGLPARDIGYLNLHGTGTELNDAMESRAVARVFGELGVPASSTKPLVGHTLGAAGALELGICWLAMSSHNASRLLPPHFWDGERDEGLPALDLVEPGRSAGRRLEASMSVSFAFGGVDVALVLGRTE